MYTPEDSPFEKFRTEKLKGVAMSPDVLELVAKAYECGFIDGMQKQMQSSVDRAVNRMAEQAEQAQPVAWIEGDEPILTWFKTEPEAIPLYTAPPPRQPLTDEEIKPLIQKAMVYYGYDNIEHWSLTSGAGFYILARAIEAKLKEKNT